MSRATGIVRRIDELGRIVIPKEIRRTLRLRESDPMEIWIGDSGDLMLRKYSALAELDENLSRIMCGTLSNQVGLPVLITDNDKVVCVNGHRCVRAMAQKQIHDQYYELLESARIAMGGIYDKNVADFVPIVVDSNDTQYNGFYACPIVRDNEVVGSVCVVFPTQKEQDEPIKEELVWYAASILGKIVDE